MSAVITDYLDFGKSDKTFYLYDSFEGLPEQYSTEAERAGTNPVYGAASQEGSYTYESVAARFRQYSNVKVIRGLVPESLKGTAPDRIAYLHIDMNAAAAEIGALEFLFDRVTPGGFLIFDDFGHALHHAQFEAETAWMASRGYFILELPTGQGLVIKR
jgi:O-methyltransferase